MKTAEIRSRFLKYFADRGHAVVASSPLVPANDPTLLFTNAGMVQFKEVFLGRDRRPYRRAVSVQRCVRAGGKHNDLENVGYTARHHTFFEMLGNFSFGDYFKGEAIAYAWQFLVDELGLDPARLWVTVHVDDDEAARIWREEIGVDEARLTRIAGEDNFWSMGDTGPCGPCSEIFFDHGAQVAGGPPGTPTAEGDRYTEIWNLVFMQYNRDGEGTMTPLPKPSVDTGMGLERLAAVLQGVHSNYEIDLFQALIRAAARATGAADREEQSLYVIADHIRSCAFLLADGVVPANEGRGYVLRRVIRRACRHGHRLGVRGAFFHTLVAALDEQMGDAYPELRRAKQQIARVLKKEETRFGETLEQGLKILEQELAGLRGRTIPGDVVFRLYDTYGFPVDLTADIAREKGLAMDLQGYEQAMAGQRARGRGASRFAADYSDLPAVGEKTQFTGYEQARDAAPVTAVLRGRDTVEALTDGQEGIVILKRTPFYAESGGQVGDRGVLRHGDTLFDVHDTRVLGGDAIGHVGRVRAGQVKVGEVMNAEIDGRARVATARNHSATHLLHAALKEILGEHVQQKGSLVAADRLRFDFSHFEPVTAQQLEAIEERVNTEIRHNHVVDTQLMEFEAAKAAGAVALFGEKYGTQVRVVGMGEFSTELCGGTHVRRTGDIGLFRLVGETGIAAGVRRVEALTGAGALASVREQGACVARVAGALKSPVEAVDERVAQLLERLRDLERENTRLQDQLTHTASTALADRAREIAGARVVAARLDGADARALRTAMDDLKSNMAPGVFLLASIQGGRVLLAAGVTAELVDRVHAGKLVAEVASALGGKGGGRADMAQGGGENTGALDGALESVYAHVEERLK